MNTQNNKLAYTTSIGVGIVIWYLFNLFTNVADPQSNILYWYIGYPILILAAFILSYCFSIKAWRWPLCLILSQLVVGIIASKSLNLLPLGMIVHIVISVPCFIAGYAGVFLKKYVKDKAL